MVLAGETHAPKLGSAYTTTYTRSVSSRTHAMVSPSLEHANEGVEGSDPLLYLCFQAPCLRALLQVFLRG